MLDACCLFYQDNFLPRSIISFFYSDDGDEWKQLGSNHTNGLIIDLIENDSYFEVGGWGDGQSPGGQHLSGFLNKVVIQTVEYKREFTFSKSNRDKDYYLLTPELRNEYKNNVDNWDGQEDLTDDMANGATCAPITDYSSYANRLMGFTVIGLTANDTYGSCLTCDEPVSYTHLRAHET